MRRSISHNSIAMQSHNQRQPQYQLAQNSYHPQHLQPIQVRTSSPLQPNLRYDQFEDQLSRNQQNRVRQDMFSSYPATNSGASMSVGPMSMFGDFLVEPSNQQLKMHFFQPDVNEGNSRNIHM